MRLLRPSCAWSNPNPHPNPHPNPNPNLTLTSGATDAALLVELSAPVSAVLLRTDQPPSAATHATTHGLVERVSADVAAPPG